MRSPRRVALLSLAVAAAVSALMFGGKESQPPAKAQPHPPVVVHKSPALRLEGAKAYRWQLSTRVASDTAGDSGVETAFAGTLNLRGMTSGDRRTMAIQLSALEVRVMGRRDSRMEAAFSTPFAVDVGVNGQFGQSWFPSGLPAADRATLDTVLRALQVVLPRTNEARWRATESDQNGEYEAEYQLVADRSFFKKKVRYTSYRRASVFSIRVAGSNLNGELDKTGLWLARADGDEHLELYGPGGHVLARVDARFTLEPLASPPASDLAFWRQDFLAPLAEKVDSNVRIGESSWDEALLDAQRKEFTRTGVTLHGLVAEVARRRPDDLEFAQRFAAFLRVFPAEAARVPALLLAGADALVAAVLVNVLELAGTPQSQAALLQIVDGTRQSHDNCVRAFIALSGVAQPSAETVDGLMRFYELHRKGESADLASQAVLTLGSLAERSSDDLRDKIRDKLEGELSRAADPAEQQALLRAFANGRLAPKNDTLDQYRTSPSPAVREAAARQLGSLGGAGAQAALLELASDESGDVRRAAMAGLAQLDPDTASNKAIARRLGRDHEPDSRNRLEAARYLAATMDLFPGNEQLLREALRRETDRDVLLGILNALPR